MKDQRSHLRLVDNTAVQWPARYVRAVRLRTYVAAQLCSVPAGRGQRAAAELIAAGMGDEFVRIESEGGQDAVYGLVAAFEHAPAAAGFLEIRPGSDPGVVLQRFDDWPHEVTQAMARRVVADSRGVIVLFPTPLTTEALAALYE